MRRTFGGLILAIFVAPVATALCFEAALLLTLDAPAKSLSDEIGGGSVFLLIALLFGGFLAAAPVLILGGITVAVARLIGVRSAVYYATVGLLAGLLISWMDAGRTKSAFDILEAVPFVVGGCLSALAYWSLAER